MTAVTVRRALQTKRWLRGWFAPRPAPSCLKEARGAGVSKQEAKLSGFEVSAVPVRLFAEADQKAALDWAAARRESRFSFSRRAGPATRGADYRARANAPPESLPPRRRFRWPGRQALRAFG